MSFRCALLLDHDWLLSVLISYALLNVRYRAMCDVAVRSVNAALLAGHLHEMFFAVDSTDILAPPMVLICYYLPSERSGGRLNAFDFVYGQVTKAFEIINQKVRLTNEAL